MTARDEAIEAAGRQILREMGYEPRDDRPIGSAWRAAGKSVLAASVPALFNDLADRIAALDPVEAALAGQHAFADVAALVRAAAEGWGATNG